MRLPIKRRLWVAIALLAGASGAWWAWSVRRAQPIAADRGGHAPFVQLAGRGEPEAARLLQERADYFDPTPLFLPTPHNYGQSGLPRRLFRGPGQVFANFPAKLNFTDGRLPAYGDEIVMAPESLPEVLARANEAPFDGLGERAGRAMVFAPRAGIVQIKSMAGKDLESLTLSDATLGVKEFAPMEFVVAVGVAGLIGKPMLVASSGLEEVDTYFRDYLARTMRLGERLAPGRYRVLVGP